MSRCWIILVLCLPLLALAGFDVMDGVSVDSSWNFSGVTGSVEADGGGTVAAAESGYDSPFTPRFWLSFSDTNLTNLGSDSNDGISKPSAATGVAYTNSGVNAVVGSPNFGRGETNVIFDGSDDYIQATDGTIYDTDKQGTITVWIKPDDITADSIIFFSGDKTDPDSDVLIFIDSLEIVHALVREGGPRFWFFELDNAVPVGQWTHLTVFGNELTTNGIYVNGTNAPVTYTDGAPNVGGWLDDVNNVDELVWGANIPSGSPANYFPGEMAHPKYFTNVFTQAQASNEWWNTGGQGSPIPDNRDENGY